MGGRISCLRRPFNQHNKINRRPCVCLPPSDAPNPTHTPPTHHQKPHQAAQRDELAHFALHEDKLPQVADYVEAVIHERFGDQGGIAAVPNHSRYRHFEPGGVDRLAQVIY